MLFDSQTTIYNIDVRWMQHTGFKHSRGIFEGLSFISYFFCWWLLWAVCRETGAFEKQSSNSTLQQFVTQQEIVCVSLLKEELLHGRLQVPADALGDLGKGYRRRDYITTISGKGIRLQIQPLNLSVPGCIIFCRTFMFSINWNHLSKFWLRTVHLLKTPPVHSQWKTSILLLWIRARKVRNSESPRAPERGGDAAR